MIDITQQLLAYREVVRHIWNSCLASRAHTASAQEAYERVCEELFGVLVLDSISSNENVNLLNNVGFQSIRVVPLIPEGVPILVNRESPSGPYWDAPLTAVSPSSAELTFIGFFDWDSYGQIDLQYFRVRILSSTGNPQTIGHEALIEVRNAKVVEV